MDEKTTPTLSVSDFVASVNQTFEFAYPAIAIEGEVSSFKVNQNKWVFFDLKDDDTSVGCFMSVFQLRTPLEDGMKIIARITPKLTKWGKFSVTIQSYRPSGEGSLKKSFELLRAKLEKEGLFNEERKRALPAIPTHIGVVSSTQAAGYADFIKIINERWGGLKIDVAHTQVQGEQAADQIIAAINYFNEQDIPPEVLVIIRGGGSADDLSVFNDEKLVRAIAASRVPTLTGIGHEIDTTLADLAADVRAATPSNAAQIIVPDKREIASTVRGLVSRMTISMDDIIDDAINRVVDSRVRMLDLTRDRIADAMEEVSSHRRVLAAYNPEAVLKKGYAIVRGSPLVGATLEIIKENITIEAEVKNVRESK